MVGWAELHQTDGGECSQTILSGQVCFRISKSSPVSAQRPPTNGPLPKMGVEMGCFVPLKFNRGHQTWCKSRLRLRLRTWLKNFFCFYLIVGQNRCWMPFSISKINNELRMFYISTVSVRRPKAWPTRLSHSIVQCWKFVLVKNTANHHNRCIVFNGLQMVLYVVGL